MEALFFIFLASFLDPIRWIICIASVFFIKNIIYALAVNIVAIAVIQTLIQPSAKLPIVIIISAIATTAITLAIYFALKKYQSMKIQKQ
ncbi:hypothetical protein HUC12_09880 [Escherichia coli]|nr:hypothetical protein [Escherichia coli]NUC41338.1 hypothetical protein [Escherichia coli]NUD01293.1 hypothetical protein [Escherichia coli]NUD36196.1 hypothetical protein [Escherichia coli]NUE09948.1 hypothetical protein [Escherichia coli]NUE23096.1 hypothetical protein [Escherichia coli]